MTQILSTLKKGGRAAIIALALGSASLTAVPTPAMAQSGPSFSFQIGIGTGDGSLTLRFGDDHDHFRFCLTNKQIRRGLRAEGFRNIDIVRRTHNRVEVIASFGHRWYRLLVNRCTGRVQIIERLHRGFPGSGFGLQFNFGM